MSQVYEGTVQNFKNSQKNSESTNLLTTRGEIFYNGRLVPTPKKFHFWDQTSQKIYRVNRSKHLIVPETELTELTNTEAGKMYFAKKQKWIPVDVPSGPLPEIQIVEIGPQQKFLYLDHPRKDIIIPIRGSNFSKITNPLPLDILENRSRATLSYLLIHFEKDSENQVEIEVRLIYKLLFKETLSPLPLLTLLPPSSLGVSARRIYFADARGDFSVFLKSGIRCLRVSGSSMVACIQQQRTSNGLKCLFRHRVTGNKDLPSQLPALPSSDFEKLTLYETRNGQIYKGERLLHRENFSEVLQLEYVNSENLTIRQDLLVQYGSLFDKMLTVELVYRASQLTNSSIDCTFDLQKLLPKFLTLPENLDFYYLSNYRGFNLKNSEENKGRLIVRLESPLIPGKIYDLIRRILIKGTLRPIELKIKILPAPRKVPRN